MSEIETRRLRASDRADWDEIWASYLKFYGTTLTPEVTQHTFERLIGDGRFIGMVAVERSEVIGIAHVVVGPNTWSGRDDGYLEDLAVRPDMRRRGAGRALIEAVVEHGRQEGWRRIHWLTESSNDRARGLYDQVGDLTDYVRYAIDLDDDLDHDLD